MKKIVETAMYFTVISGLKGPAHTCTCTYMYIVYEYSIQIIMPAKYSLLLPLYRGIGRISVKGALSMCV